MSGAQQNNEFYRMRRLPRYLFEEVNSLKAEYRERGHDIIDLGMGNPDSPTPSHIVAKLKEVADLPKSGRYSVSRGILGLRLAQAAYYKRRFGVTLDSESEVIVTLGSKEGLANMAQAITAPGDVILVPNPSYPIHAFGFIIAGASIRHIPAHTPEDFLRNLYPNMLHSVPRPTALVISYPSNPMAQSVDLDFYKEIVAFARKYGVWVLSDIAYAELYFENNPPPSILQVDGAKEVAVEFSTLSKTYSMPGWRVGFAVGNPKLIHALRRVKSYLDYGAFLPIQVAAATALNGSQECVVQARELYRERRDVLIESFGNAGWSIPKPDASMFCWAPLPEQFRHMGSIEFSKMLLTEAKLAVAPGIGFGEYGDGHVRIGLVENTQRIRQAARNLKKVFDKVSHRSS